MDDTEEQLQELADKVLYADMYFATEDDFDLWIEAVGGSVLAARKIVATLADYIRWCRTIDRSRRQANDIARAWLIYSTLFSDKPRPTSVAQCLALNCIDLGRLKYLWRTYVKSHATTQADIKLYFASFKDDARHNALPPLSNRKQQPSELLHYEDEFLACTELPESHLTASEIAALDAYITAETKKIRDNWTPEEEAERRGVPMGHLDLKVESCGFIHAPVSPICLIEPLPGWYDEPAAEY